MLDLRQVFTSRSSSASVLQTLIARMLVLGLNFLTGVTVARALAPVGRGEQAAIMLWPALLTGLLGFGVPVALRYQVRKFPELANDLLVTASILAIFNGLLATAVGFVFMPVWLAKYSHGAVVDAKIIMLFAPNVMIGNILQAILEAKGDFFRSNQIFLLPPLATLVSLLILAVLHRLEPFSASLAYMGPSVFLNGFMAYRIRRLFRLDTNKFRTSVTLLVRYGLSTYGLDILGTLSQTVDSALVIGFLTSSGLGIYTVSLAASRLVNIIANSLNAVLFPKASGLQTSEAVALVAQAARVGFAASTLGGILFSLILPFLLPAVYGKAFESAIPVTRILTIDIIVQGTISTYAQAFMATGRPLTVTLFQFIGLCVSIPLMFLLIPRFGLIGAAASLLASSIVRFILVYCAYPAILKIRFPSIVLTRDDIRFLRARLQKA